MTAELVRKAVSAYFAALRAMDADAWVATFAEDGVTQDPASSPPVRGHAALKQLAGEMWGPWQQVGLQEQEIFVVANVAAVKWAGKGRAKNGRDLQFEGIDVITVNERGKIQFLQGYWDTSVLAQLAAKSQAWEVC
jgi:steroid delta-isomerase